MTNKRQWDMTDWIMKDNDDWRTLVNDEHDMTNNGEIRHIIVNNNGKKF